MRNNAHQFQSQRSKVNVTRPTNAETGSASYLTKETAYELKLDDEDPYGRIAVMDRSRKSRVDSRTKSPRNIKIVQ